MVVPHVVVGQGWQASDGTSACEPLPRGRREELSGPSGGGQRLPHPLPAARAFPLSLAPSSRDAKHVRGERGHVSDARRGGAAVPLALA